MVVLVVLVTLLSSCNTPELFPRAESLKGTTQEPLEDDQYPVKVTCSVVVTIVALLVFVAGTTTTTSMVTISRAPSFGLAKVLPTLPLRNTGTCSTCQACAGSARCSEADHAVLAVSPLLRTVAAARDLLVLTTVARTNVILSS